jgi:hypothetical protein
MRLLVSDRTVITTRMEPVAAHLAHLRHLARPSGLQKVLRDVHEYPARDAKRLAEQVAPFVEQALNFHEVSRQAVARVRPLLQYYSYLNFAVAAVLIFRPPSWQDYKHHGAQDVARSLSRLTLASEIVRVRKGAISLFHSIVGGGPLPSRNLTFRELVVPLPMLAAELDEFFRVRPLKLVVTASIQPPAAGDITHLANVYELKVHDEYEEHRRAGFLKRFPSKRLNGMMPVLTTAFSRSDVSDAVRRYISTQTWTTGHRDRAVRSLEESGLQLVNFGGQLVDPEGSVQYFWRFDSRCALIPTATAGLLLSFALSSIVRYRANLLDRVESSKANLICEIFTSEAEGFMIPIFRNLLHGRAAHMERVSTT